jgi:hypothetical protein
LPTPEHPGRTAAQRKALDLIGCGENAPMMSNRTRDALLREGLIVKLPTSHSIPLHPSQPHGLAISIAQYEMPIPVHMQWCEYWAQFPDENE